MPPPSAAALHAFGAGRADLEALPGGQATAWRAAEIVLKPLDMSVDALRWQEEVLSSVVPDGFRVAAPLRSDAGELVVDGWTAWPALAGDHAPRWPDIVAVGDRFHRALAAVERPTEILESRTDRWARADRFAWGESAEHADAGVPEVARLLAARGVCRAPRQLVHGDLSGNALFADDLPPAIIDLSPYWRPAAYATTIVLVDAVLWYGADLALLPRVAGRDAGGELLIRALLFRLLSEREPAAAAPAYRPAVEHACRLALG
jgi:uncharacterized protein (TIGR02569 family)